MYSDEAVYVVFGDDSGQWWSPILKKGIRHCKLIAPCNGQWVIYEKVAKRFDLYIVDSLDGIIGDTDRTIKAVKVTKQRGLFMLNTCVSHCKQILGITNPFILTPYQLLKHLKRLEKIK